MILFFTHKTSDRPSHHAFYSLHYLWENTKSKTVTLFHRASASAELWGTCVYCGSNICSAHGLIFTFLIPFHCISWKNHPLGSAQWYITEFLTITGFFLSQYIWNKNGFENVSTNYISTFKEGKKIVDGYDFSFQIAQNASQIWLKSFIFSDTLYLFPWEEENTFFWLIL